MILRPIRREQGMSPRTDPNFPERLLLANGIQGKRVQVLVQQFNLGKLPNELTIREPKMRNLVSVLKSHYKYGHLKKE
jgi:hypothetical protein